MVDPPKIDPFKANLVKKLLTMGLFAIPVPMLGTVLFYMMKQINFVCLSKCLSQQKFPKRLCYAQCDWLSANEVVNKLEKQYKKCDKERGNRYKCKEKLLDALGHWKDKEAQEKINFDSELRIAYKQRLMRKKPK
jgi:hypothetical protein